MRWLQVCFMLALIAHHSAAGRIVFEGPIFSKILATNRTVRIYVPPSYTTNLRKRYPVLYLHDGQNVFSTAGTNVAFGWGNWDLDHTVDRLVVEKQMREIIMVAVDNTRDRYAEYRGPRATGHTNENGRASRQTARTDVKFEQYAEFLIKELKPRIDKEYRTLKGPANTAIMGSSLGGICSVALAWENPRTFGGAASLSGSFQVEQRHFLENILRPYKKRTKSIRFYLDSGTIDFTGDDDGRRNTAAVVAELRRIGWKEGRNLEYFVDEHTLAETELESTGLRRDKWKEAQKSQHNEFYWKQRAWRPLVFLFPPK